MRENVNKTGKVKKKKGRKKRRGALPIELFPFGTPGRLRSKEKETVNNCIFPSNKRLVGGDDIFLNESVSKLNCILGALAIIHIESMFFFEKKIRYLNLVKASASDVVFLWHFLFSASMLSAPSNAQQYGWRERGVGGGWRKWRGREPKNRFLHTEEEEEPCHFQAKKRERKRKEWATNNETIVWASKHREGKKKEGTNGPYRTTTTKTTSSTVCVSVYTCTTTTTANTIACLPSPHPLYIAAGYTFGSRWKGGGYYVACLLFNGTTEKPSGSGSFKSLPHTTACIVSLSLSLCMCVCVCLDTESAENGKTCRNLI